MPARRTKACAWRSISSARPPTLTTFYEVLADPALAKVVRTALVLPDSFASADIDQQVKLFESKLDIEDFSDPEKLGKFLTRFTSLWEINNPTAPAQSAGQRAVQPAGRVRRLDRPAVRHPEDEVLRSSRCRTVSTSPCPPRSRWKSG